MLPLALLALVAVVVACALAGRRRARAGAGADRDRGDRDQPRVDAPKGLDEGEAALAYEGASASLLEGFWLQIATGAVLIACGVMLPLYLRPARATVVTGPSPAAVIAGQVKAGGARAPRPRLRMPSLPRRRRGSPAGEAQGPGGRNVSRDGGAVERRTRLLPLAVIAAAVCLFASELMTVFDFTPPGAEPLCAQGGADRHGNALIVLAVFAVVALVIAIFAGSKPAAIAVAAAGGVALLIFLIGDLRVANAQGSLNEGCGAARRLVHRRQGGPAGRLLARDGRLAGADGHRDRAGDDDPGSAARPAAAAPPRGRPRSGAGRTRRTPGTGARVARERRDRGEGAARAAGRRPRTRQRG